MANINPQYANYLMDYYSSWLGAPTGLLRAIAKVESGYDEFTGDFNNVCNSVRACGMMQLRPNALADIYDKFGMSLNPLDPIQAIIGAVALIYITKMYIYKTTGQTPDWDSVIIGYNQGWTAGRGHMLTGNTNSAGNRYLDKVTQYL